jgi:hypothetical protein
MNVKLLRDCSAIALQLLPNRISIATESQRNDCTIIARSLCNRSTIDVIRSAIDLQSLCMLDLIAMVDNIQSNHCAKSLHLRFPIGIAVQSPRNHCAITAKSLRNHREIITRSL